jgi:hypothetical protein
VSCRETSESEPPVNCRKRIVDVRTGIGGHPGISRSGVLKPGSGGIRLGGGVTLEQALGRKGRTCRPREPVERVLRQRGWRAGRC